MQIKNSRYFNVVEDINTIRLDINNQLIECYQLELALETSITEGLTEVILEAAGNDGDSTLKKWYDKITEFIRNAVKKVIKVTNRVVLYLTNFTKKSFGINLDEMMDNLFSNKTTPKTVISGLIGNDPVITMYDNFDKSVKFTLAGISQVIHFYSAFNMTGNKTKVPVIYEAITEGNIEAFEKAFEKCVKTKMNKSNEENNKLKLALINLLLDYTKKCGEINVAINSNNMTTASNRVASEIDRMTDQSGVEKISEQATKDITKITKSVSRFAPIIGKTMSWAAKQTSELKVTKEAK